ncbi:MAG TPA: hypothetical protein VKF41_01740 [Bryobacteraceae bacterium]|nr:hypothetical protein [Bryobacteraceae bacterium]
MNSRTLPVAFLLAVSAVPLCGQPGQVGGPVVGFVFDGSAAALRPILGIPGASTLGAPLDAGFGMSWAVVAPRQDSAIVSDSSGALHLLRLGSGIAEVRCSACPATAGAAVFSPSGTAVALYEAGRVQILTGLPDAPVPGANFEVVRPSRAARGGAPAPGMALSDDGAWLLVSAPGSADLLAANGGPRQLLRTGAYPLVAFAAGGHDAAVADPGRGVLTVIRDVAGASVEQSLIALGGIRHARALAFSGDGARLFLAIPAEQSVSAIEIASGTVKTAACDCSPALLTAMGKVLRLNETGAGPLWLLDGEAAAEPRLVFVPAAQ